LIKKLLILAIISTSLLGCKRFDREYVPGPQKFMGLVNIEQFKPRAYRNQHFDHVPAPRHDAEAIYENQKSHITYVGRPKYANKVDQDQSYEKGFQAGCQTFASVMGSGLARIRGHNVDAEELSANPWYLRGYQDASTYCTLTLDWEVH